eukprot:CAMPEP_0206248660 /NCGR_PEP_ID=MMETSP0047_2-20121206/20487_1 /ASSEMBLY_ACC=CAM_ASM_000192 /TAXON_ID=195065 /ORGANISM="Chroomonas mesostigmatica_cf, Strain CCMP1168" /LENGTH=199 /DNA_ID=CAMNT_0053674317 /DNA_START=182 /DNA_END=778 /DNA_ORIENTATION=-
MPTKQGKNAASRGAQALGASVLLVLCVVLLNVLTQGSFDNLHAPHAPHGNASSVSAGRKLPTAIRKLATGATNSTSPSTPRIVRLSLPGACNQSLSGEAGADGGVSPCMRKGDSSLVPSARKQVVGAAGAKRGPSADKNQSKGAVSSSLMPSADTHRGNSTEYFKETHAIPHVKAAEDFPVTQFTPHVMSLLEIFNFSR